MTTTRSPARAPSRFGAVPFRRLDPLLMGQSGDSPPRHRRRRASAPRAKRPWGRPLVADLYQDAMARTSGLIVATTIITAILGFGYWVLAARAYTPGAVGTAAVSISAMIMAALISILGAASAVVQRIPSRASPREWSAAVTSSLAIALLSGLLAGFIGWLIIVQVVHAASLRTPLYGIGLTAGVALTNCSTVLDNVWIVERSAQVSLLTNTVMSLVKLPLLLLPVLRDNGAAGIQLSWTAALLVTVGLSLTLLRRRRGYRFVLAGVAREVRDMQSNLVGNHIVSIGAAAPTYVVPILVGASVSLAHTAYFYSAWRVGSFFFIGGLAVSSALFAEGSRNPARAIRRARQALFMIVPLLLVATVVLTLLGPAVLAAFGSAYRTHALVLLILLVGAAVPNALNIVYMTTLRIQRRYVQASCFMWFLAIVQIGLTWWLVHLWGITGAGVAWLCAEGVGVLIQGVDHLWFHYLLAPLDSSTGTKEMPKSASEGTLLDDVLR